MLTKALRLFSLAALIAVWISIPGCTSRSITVTSSPPGAEVLINYRMVGKTPCRVGFTYYGVYHVELRMEKYEILERDECINTPGYAYDPINFVTDNAIPARLNDDLYFHYILKKTSELSDRNDLLKRMESARMGNVHLPGREVVISYSVPPKSAEQTAKDAMKPGDTTNPATGAPVPPVGPNPNDFKITPIPTEEPKGPTIGKDLNIKPTVPGPDKKPDGKQPDGKEPKKELGPPRTPKPEELIFDKPTEQKKDGAKPDEPKKDEPKKDAPKKDDDTKK